MTGADEPGTARREVFALLEHVDTVDEFFGRLADDVRWTLFGKHPLAGAYRGREEFVPATIGQVRPLLDTAGCASVSEGCTAAGR